MLQCGAHLKLGKIKNCIHCNSPIKCWFSSGPSPLRPSDWLWLACGWERVRGSAGQTSRVFQIGADIVIILSVGPTIQMSKLTVHDSEVWELSHRKQGWVCIMKPKKEGNMKRDGVLKRIVCGCFGLSGIEKTLSQQHDSLVAKVGWRREKKNHYVLVGGTFHSKLVLFLLRYLKISLTDHKFIFF